jgi:hypothetical protein
MMNIRTFVKCFIQIGPFVTEVEEEVENIDPDPIKDRYKEELRGIQFFERHEIVVDGVKYTSDPINVQEIRFS